MSTIKSRMWLIDDVLCIEIPREALENHAKITLELTSESSMFQLTTVCHDERHEYCKALPDCDFCEKCHWNDEGFLKE